MKNEEILDNLNKIHLQSFSLENLDVKIQDLKLDFVKNGNQEQAKLLWIYQTIIKIHNQYVTSFNLLKRKSYFEAWCELERIEKMFSSLKKHFIFNKKQYFLWHIEKSVKNIQVLYPYRLFASSEILKKKKICSVCEKEISIRNSCEHKIFEIYNGEMCHRIVTESELLGISIVENPENKNCVMFFRDEKTGKQIDKYNYETIDYLFEHIVSPYEFWDLEVSQRENKKEDLGNVGRNNPCSCNSGKKFKKCCMLNIGKKYPHYEIIVQNASNKTLLTNTLKNKNTSN